MQLKILRNFASSFIAFNYSPLEAPKLASLQSGNPCCLIDGPAKAVFR